MFPPVKSKSHSPKSLTTSFFYAYISQHPSPFIGWFLHPPTLIHPLYGQSLFHSSFLGTFLSTSLWHNLSAQRTRWCSHQFLRLPVLLPLACPLGSNKSLKKRRLCLTLKNCYSVAIHQTKHNTFREGGIPPLSSLPQPVPHLSLHYCYMLQPLLYHSHHYFRWLKTAHILGFNTNFTIANRHQNISP